MSFQDTSSNTGQSAAPTQAASSVTEEEVQANYEELLSIWGDKTKTILQSKLDELTRGISGGSEWREAFIVADRIRKNGPEEVDEITSEWEKSERKKAKKAGRSAVGRARTLSMAGGSASGSSGLITEKLTEEPEEMSE